MRIKVADYNAFLIDFLLDLKERGFLQLDGQARPRPLLILFGLGLILNLQLPLGLSKKTRHKLGGIFGL